RAPIFDYGRGVASWTVEDGDGHTADASGGDLTIRLQTDLAMGAEGDRVRARHVLNAGERAVCSRSCGADMPAPAAVDEAIARIDATVRFWRAWLGRARIPDHRWREPIQRS